MTYNVLMGTLNPTHSLSYDWNHLAAAKWQTAGIKFTHRPKISFFCPTGATPCTDSRQTWHGRWAPESTWLCKISPQSVQGWECGPKIKNFHFLVKSLLAGANPFTDFYIFMGFYMPIYLTLVFQIWHDSLRRLRSYCWETTRPSIRPNFSVHPVGKTMH